MIQGWIKIGVMLRRLRQLDILPNLPTATPFTVIKPGDARACGRSRVDHPREAIETTTTRSGHHAVPEIDGSSPRETN